MLMALCVFTQNYHVIVSVNTRCLWQRSEYNIIYNILDLHVSKFLDYCFPQSESVRTCGGGCIAAITFSPLLSSLLVTLSLTGWDTNSCVIRSKVLADYFTETRHPNWRTAVGGGSQEPCTVSTTQSLMLIIGNTYLPFHYNDVTPLQEWPRFKETVWFVSADGSKIDQIVVGCVGQHRKVTP